jgi:cystathionine beta-lyase
VRSVIEAGHFGYPFITDGYYDSIINWFKRKTHWSFRKEAIATNVGIYTSFWTVIDALTDPGDEIIFQPPVHFCFKEIIKNNGRVPVANPLILENGKYIIDFESLQNAVSKKTKLFLLCNPPNPVGRAWSKEELEKVSEFCLSNNLRIASDDVYSGLLYNDSFYTPIASLSSDVSNITVTCSSPSKTFNITGIKHSYVICENKDIMNSYLKSLKKLDLTYGMNIMGIAATEAAYNFCDEWVREVMLYIKGNYTYLEDFFKENMPEIELYKPEATYFAWLDYRKLGMSHTELADHFENDVKIKIENGHDFGESGNGFIRMNIACTRNTLMQGLNRIKAAYDSKLL